MLSFGFYLSAVSIAQDAKLRKSVKSVIESKVLLGTIATAEHSQQIEKRILNIVMKERETIENQTGIQPPLEEDVKQYLVKVLDEVHRSKASQAA
jgi:Ni,Fe-hydrogenase maturation factor